MMQLSQIVNNYIHYPIDQVNQILSVSIPDTDVFAADPMNDELLDTEVNNNKAAKTIKKLKPTRDSLALDSVTKNINSYECSTSQKSEKSLIKLDIKSFLIQIGLVFLGATLIYVVAN